MMDKNNIINIAEEFLKDSSDYLVDVIISAGNIITVEIDNDNGVNIDNCADLSRFIESKFDREAEDFELTVTSAGLTSPFKTQRQYKKHIGDEVEVLTKEGKKLRGFLTEATDNGFTIEAIKLVKPEGAKRKIEVKEKLPFNYNEVKYTKYQIRF